MESPNTNPQAVELNLSCSRQAHPNMPATGTGYKNMEPGGILTILRVPFIAYTLKSADTKSGKLFKRFRAAGTNGRLDLSLSWQSI